MSGHWLDGPAYWVATGVLAVAVVGVAVALGVTVVLPELTQRTDGTAEASPAPSDAASHRTGSRR